MKNCKGDCKKQYTNKVLKENDGYCERCYKEKLKKKCWIDYNGIHATGQCYACKCIINDESYYVGYIISLTNGGKDIISNMRPVCIGCKIKCNNENLNDYSKSLKKKNLPVPMEVEPPSFYIK